MKSRRAHPRINAGNADRYRHASLLIIEIGNSHVTVATAVGGGIRTSCRFAPDRLDDLADAAAQAWAALPEERARCVLAASVVPKTLAALRPRLADATKEPVFIVGEDVHRPMSAAVEVPERIGIDRLCAAAAAYEVVQGPCVVAGFGTAITIDCVNGEGVFLGGSILPGLRLQAWALHAGTARLPQVEIGPAASVYGCSTEEAIRNGVVHGAAGALREIVERYATELGRWPDLIVTGGDAELMGRHCPFVDRIVPDLILRGIELAHRRHCESLIVE